MNAIERFFVAVWDLAEELAAPALVILIVCLVLVLIGD